MHSLDLKRVFVLMCFLGMAPLEATFKGDEYLSYDLVQLGGQPILSTQDEISLHFKTTRPDGLLFHTGEFHPLQGGSHGTKHLGAWSILRSVIFQ